MVYKNVWLTKRSSLPKGGWRNVLQYRLASGLTYLVGSARLVWNFNLFGKNFFWMYKILMMLLLAKRTSLSTLSPTFYIHFLYQNSIVFNLYFTDNCVELLLDMLGFEFCTSCHNFVLFHQTQSATKSIKNYLCKMNVLHL
jgi:hypothetical protein